MNLTTFNIVLFFIIVSILIVSCILIYVIQVFGDSLCKNICKRKISPHVLENTDE